MAVATKKRAEAFTILHFERWAEELTLDNDENWLLEDFQRDFVEDLFGYRVCWAVWPEGNTKTTTLAGVALYHIEFKRMGYVAVAASSRDQAEWIYRQAEGFVTRNGIEDLTRSTADRCTTPHRFRTLEGYRRIRHDATRARIQIFAADERGGDGAIATLYLLDELHRHKNLALYRTWMGKVKKRQGSLAAISTAGEVGSEFEEERTKFRQGGVAVRNGAHTRVEHENAVLHEWALEETADPEDLKAVLRAQPFSGITLADLREKRELPGMTADHWARFTCNRASRSPNAAITEAEWNATRTAERIPEGEAIWAGLDVGWKHDTTAIMPFWMPSLDVRRFGPAEILVPPRNGNSMDPDLIKGALFRVNAVNPIHTVVMDMSRAEDVAHWIERELGASVVDRSQQNQYQVAEYDSWMKGMRERTIQHQGDAGFTRHAMNAVAKTLPGGDTVFTRPANTWEGPGQEMRVWDALKAAAMVHVTAEAEFSYSSEPLVAVV